MTKVTFPSGREFSDDGSTPCDMLNGGHAQHFFPLVNEVLKVGQQAVESAAAALEDRKAADALQENAKRSEDAARKSRADAAVSAQRAAADVARVAIPPLKGNDGRSLTTRGGKLVFDQPIYQVGEIRMWHGNVEDIARVWGPGWQLADGTNHTADLRDRFVIGAGRDYSVEATGGTASNVLSVAQMPIHAHGLRDPGHVHDVDDPAHGHGVKDPGHAHLTNIDFWNGGGSNLGFVGPGSGNHGSASWATSKDETGIRIEKSTTGIRVTTAHCHISMETAGGSAPVENRPPYYALCYIEYRGV